MLYGDWIDLIEAGQEQARILRQHLRDDQTMPYARRKHLQGILATINQGIAANEALFREAQGRYLVEMFRADEAALRRRERQAYVDDMRRDGLAHLLKPEDLVGLE